MDCVAFDPSFTRECPSRLGKTTFSFTLRITIGILLFSLLNSQVESAELRKSREPISALSSAQIVLVDVHLSARQTGVTPGTVEKIVTGRMEELQYMVETDRNRTHDVVVEVRCGEMSPPCLFHYRFEGRLMPWLQVERFIYSDGVKTAKDLASRSQTDNPSSRTLSYLKEFEFPLLLSAEWGQVDRLLQTFRSPTTSLSRKEMIMVLLGEIQAAAVHGLGRVGALTGDTSSTSLLLQILQAPGVNRRVQTEVVWALGKAPDFRAFPALAELEQNIWVIQSIDPELQELRQAVDWSIREVRQGGHTDDY